MHRVLQFIGIVVFFCAWPAFWLYYRLDRGRTRVLVVHEDKVLVMKQWISPGKWNLPGGGLHRGESAADGAVRELYEETSVQLDPRQFRPIGKGLYRHYGLSFDFDIFAAKAGSSSIRAQRIEISDLRWLKPSELTTENAGPDTLTSIQIARDRGLLLQ